MDCFELAIKFMKGELPNGQAIPRSASTGFDMDAKPEYEVKKGSQHFGSGGYSADWRIWGTHQVIQEKFGRDDFCSVTSHTIKVTSPIAVVLQNEGDTVSENRDWSWAKLVIPESELHDLSGFICQEVRKMGLEQVEELFNRYLPHDGVRAAVQARRTELLAKREAKRKEKALRNKERRHAAALEQARKYAADEATAQSILHLFL